MRKFYVTLFVIFLLYSTPLVAQQSLPEYGVESVDSDFFRDRYHDNDLVHYLDNLDLYVTYQAETTGQFNSPDPMIFSIEGSSYRWNSYYLDGFRIDSRFFSGSTLYEADMYNLDLALDYIGANLSFTSRKAEPSLELSYNAGGLGGISPGTKAAINLFHPSASERLYKDVLHRNKISGAGTIRLNYDVADAGGKSYGQSVYADFGERNIVSFNNTGINRYYPESFGTLQLSGELPATLWGLFDSSAYLYNLASRSAMGSEFYYGYDETSRLLSNSASFYGKRALEGGSLTTGLTLAVNSVKHRDVNFARNLLDQDGEAFEPFSPDGNNIELSHAMTLSKSLAEGLTLNIDTYNSLLYWAPTSSQWSNYAYMQRITDKKPTPLYHYSWQSKAFASALLENTASVHYERELTHDLYLQSNAGLTLDAILLGGSDSKISPNYELQAGVSYNPAEWFSAELIMARKRVAYNIEDIQFLSDDYLNGEIYYSNAGLAGDYFTSTGGALHSLSSGVRQPAYWVADIPVNFTFGKHRISFLQSIRKYTNNWITSYDKASEEYGYYKEVNGVELFYLDSGATPSYIIDNYADGIMGDSFLTSSPFYLCSNIQYRYTTDRFLFIAGWQSYMQSGLSTLGNGPLHNNLGVLSESTANPNTHINVGNPDSDYPYVGRLDQERAYVIRLFASYDVNDRLNFALNFKFKDGQPFSYFDAELASDNAGNQQIAIFPSTTRGINTFDGNFGTREDACFNFDLRATYSAEIEGCDCEFQLGFYNLYDFGVELTEYVFDQDLDTSRHAMSLSIPRGVIFSAKINL